MEVQDRNTAPPSVTNSSSNAVRVLGEPSSSSASLLSSVREEENQNRNEQGRVQNRSWPRSVSFGSRLALPNAGSLNPRCDDWSCVMMILTFCCLGSVTLILGVFGDATWRLGPNCSRLIRVNSLFVDKIEVQALSNATPSVMLYGFHELPPLQVKTNWSETHAVSLHSDSRSELDISLDTELGSSLPLILVIAQGKESLARWTEDPSDPNLTLTWKLIYGSGMIQQKIVEPSDYYIALGNLNLEDVKVRLNTSVQALQYNTRNAFYNCSLAHGFCSLKLLFLRPTYAVLTSSGPDQGTTNDDLLVKLSKNPRWIIYAIGSAAIACLLFLIFKICVSCQLIARDGNIIRTGETGSARAPLLVRKDDELSCSGCSYDSVSHDDEDLEEWLAGASQTKPDKDAEITNPQSVCAICFDGPRDCFFLPCGHCISCFTCGMRIAEEDGTCPVCRRKLKKVRKIIAV
ncbi:hypothetical protein Syun_000277 [Stephania yunnanensis]|uniref:RING-type domain-containing protein n=1 Tax=Stephania yunnanensis TaxID=152371 RepID=A0AAP0LDB5_9MAGN